MTARVLLCLRCPVCNSLPMPTLLAFGLFTCNNDECNALSWDGERTAEQQREDVHWTDLRSDEARDAAPAPEGPEALEGTPPADQDTLDDLLREAQLRELMHRLGWACPAGQACMTCRS